MEIGPTKWHSIQELFHQALERPVADRERFLDEVCPDREMRAAVITLLAEDARESPVLDGGLEDFASDLLDDHLTEGRLLGPYRILSLLGEGGMGVVYLAERTDLRNRVAIKMLRDSWVSPGGRGRFVREQKTLAQLNHPSIAKFLDAGAMPNGVPYFVVEYVDGLPLVEYCERSRSSLTERLRLFRAVCEAVQFAHRRAIIHRDIKPSNILVDREGSIKLLDFGIAKQLEALDGGDDPARTATRLLTPAYASPEQVRGEPIGVFSDVYSLGVVLYELLTGRTPFMDWSRTPAELEEALQTREPERPSAAARRREITARIEDGARIGRTAWQDLDLICLKAMQKDPARRYTSVEALVRDIDHHLRGEPLEARPDSFTYRSGRFLRRNRRGVAVAAVAGVAMVMMVGIHTVRITAERDRAQVEAGKARQLSEYLIGIFEASDPFGADGDGTDVRTLLARGEARADELMAEPELQAQMLDVLGRVQTTLSDYERAEELLNRALELRRAMEPGSLDVAETLSNLGVLHFHLGQFPEAEAAMTEALEIRSRVQPRDHPDLATTIDDLGVIISSQGDYERAIGYFEQALRIRRSLYEVPHEDLGQSLNNMAVTLYNRGDLPGAQRFYREALEVDRAVFGPDHPTVATNLANFGKLYQDLGEYDEAEANLRDALRIRESRLGASHYETGLSHSQLAGLLDVMGEYDQARHHYEAALRVQQELLGSEHPSVGTTLNGLALMLQRSGEHAAAEEAFDRVVAIYREALGPRHRFTGVALCNLATLRQETSRVTESAAAFRECVGILEEVHPPDHPELGYNLSRFGGALLAWDSIAEAGSLLRRGQSILEAAYGAEHPRTREAAALVSRLEAAP